MDLTCMECGCNVVINISTFGDPDPRHMCASCHSKNVRYAQPKHPKPVGYQPPSASQMARRLRATEKNLPPTAMERAIERKRWEEDAGRWRDDLVALLSELDPE